MVRRRLVIDGATSTTILERWFRLTGQPVARPSGHGQVDAYQLAREASDIPAAAEALRSWFTRQLAEPPDVPYYIGELRSAMVGAFLELVDWHRLATKLREVSCPNSHQQRGDSTRPEQILDDGPLQALAAGRLAQEMRIFPSDGLPAA